MGFFCIFDCVSPCPASITGNRRWAPSVRSCQSAISFVASDPPAMQALLVVRWAIQYIRVAIVSTFATFWFPHCPISGGLAGVAILPRLSRFLLRWIVLLKTSPSISAKISATTASHCLQYLVTSTCTSTSR